MDMEAVNNKDIEKLLKSKELQLHWLLQITKAINYNLPKKQLFDFCESLLKKQLKVSAFVLFVQEDIWTIKINYGHNSDLTQFSPAEEFSGFADVTESDYKKPVWLKEFETVIPVFHNGRALAYGLIGGIEGEPVSELKRWLSFIHTVVNIIVVAVENKRLGNEMLAKAEIKRELELARDMQNMLLPLNLTGDSIIDIAVTYRPHQEVGGDYYDYIKLNEYEDIICMADVSGKGMAAALLMSNLQANLRVMLNYSQSLEEVVASLNNTVSKSAKGEKFITLFIAKINCREGKISYINAGHNPPFLFNKDEFLLLDKGTVGLGMFDELPFINQGHENFPPGAMLICYTDGVVEIENLQGEQYGMERLIEIVRKYQNVLTMKDMQLALMDSFHDFRQNVEYKDDLTLLSCRSKEN